MLYWWAVLFIFMYVLSLLNNKSEVQTTLFSELGNLRMMAPFADVRSITATAGCRVDLGQVARGTVEKCDEYGRNRKHVDGVIWCYD